MIKKFIFPEVDDEVQRSVDLKSLSYIWRICLVMFFFEAVAAVLFVATRREFNHDAWVSIESASYCLILCLVGTFWARKLTKRKDLSHIYAVVFNSAYYILFSAWAEQISYRNYCRNEQLLTFFAVQLLMVCFVPLSPVPAIILSGTVYVSLYVCLNAIDGADGINVFNYCLLLVVTITGMIVRYFSEIYSSEKSVELERSYEMLFYSNRHDGLTGLRNRRALEEDVPKIAENHVTAYMIDINYFKNINDTYGHAVGDIVLKETAKWLKSIFSEDRCYRYGGDEFLILSDGGESYTEDIFTFSVPEIPDVDILLSIGHADGDPKNHDEIFKLISEADEKLYEVKKRTHSQSAG